MAGERGSLSSQFVEQPADFKREPPLWAELFRAPLEYYALRLSPIFIGCGVPRGDGKHIFVLPGMAGSDSYLFTLRDWLNRMGYRAHRSGIGINDGDILAKTSQVIESIERVAESTGKPVTIIGHSLGGVEGLHIAHLRPDLVETLVTLGSPIHGDPRAAVHPRVAEYGQRHLTISPELIEEYRRITTIYSLHPQVDFYNVYSKTDGVLDWHATVHPQASRLEIHGSHSGMATNWETYQHLGQILAGRRKQPQNGASLPLAS